MNDILHNDFFCYTSFLNSFIPFIAYSPSPNVVVDKIMRSFSESASFTHTTDANYNVGNSETYEVPNFDVIGVKNKTYVGALIADHFPRHHQIT